MGFAFASGFTCGILFSLAVLCMCKVYFSMREKKLAAKIAEVNSRLEERLSVNIQQEV